MPSGAFTRTSVRRVKDPSFSAGGPPVIVNAVLDAIAEHGVAHIDMPLSPMKVWRAMSGIA
jgi:hypothetical protein